MYERISINCCHCYFNEYKETNIKRSLFKFRNVNGLFYKGRVIKMGKNELLMNIYKIHTTYLGISRIKRNLGIEEDVVEFCKNKVLDKKSLIYRKGKNWYIENGAIKITINATSYTIITAHIIK